MSVLPSYDGKKITLSGYVKTENVTEGYAGLFMDPDGRETQRIGIVPDIEVKPTIKGVREGRDELLEKAIEIIEKE
jgi:C-terminal processing protease CtpA/Prc